MRQGKELSSDDEERAFVLTAGIAPPNIRGRQLRENEDGSKRPIEDTQCLQRLRHRYDFNRDLLPIIDSPPKRQSTITEAGIGNLFLKCEAIISPITINYLSAPTCPEKSGEL